jgi:hypothetical protein
MSSRDTQFAGFAKLLFDDLNNNACITLADHPDFDHLCELQDKINALTKLIIARRAYDLVAHVLNNEKLQWYPMEEISIEEIPDFTGLPNLKKTEIGTLYYGDEEMSRGLPPMPGPSRQAEQMDEL